MNRAQRRAAARRAPAHMRAFALAYRCPDCLSETAEPVLVDARGVWRVNVHHDETCPTYRRLKANGLISPPHTTEGQPE